MPRSRSAKPAHCAGPTQALPPLSVTSSRPLARLALGPPARLCRKCGRLWPGPFRPDRSRPRPSAQGLGGAEVPERRRDLAKLVAGRYPHVASRRVIREFKEAHAALSTKTLCFVWASALSPPNEASLEKATCFADCPHL